MIKVSILKWQLGYQRKIKILFTEKTENRAVTKFRARVMVTVRARVVLIAMMSKQSLV